MKVLRYWLCAIAALAIFASCEELGDDNQLIIDPVEDALLEQTVGSEAITAEGVSFTTTGAWTSQVVPVSTKASQPMWVSITPDHGDEAGTYTISINLEANDTGEDRKANIIISCGEQTITISITQVATPEVPSQGEVPTPEYKKYVSKLEWKFTDYDGEQEEDVLTFEYDDKNRIACMKRDYEDSYDQRSWRWSFNYSIVGEVELTLVISDEYQPRSSIVDATLDDTGRVSRYVYKDGEDYGRFEYDSEGYLSAMMQGEKTTDGGVEEEGVKLFYTDGLLSGTQWWDKEDTYTEYEYEQISYLNAIYASRYLNDKINVDLNPYIMEGDFGVDEEQLYIAMRLCGKFTDCLMEIGGVYDEAVEADRWHEYTTPDVIIPMKYITVRTEVPETGNPIEWTFDDEGCPLTATETFNYQEYEVTYDIVVGNTVIGERPALDPDTETEVMVKLYDYTTTPKQYTKTANSWSCPKVLTVTYREQDLNSLIREVAKSDLFLVRPAWACSNG